MGCGDTHKAGVLATSRIASANHVPPDVYSEVCLLEHVVAHAVVEDGYLHFLESVGRWQTCAGTEQRDGPLDPLLLAGMA